MGQSEKQAVIRVHRKPLLTRREFWAVPIWGERARPLCPHVHWPLDVNCMGEEVSPWGGTGFS